MRMKGTLMTAEEIGNTLRRLAHQIVEHEGGAEHLVIIGIRTRGVTVAKRIREELLHIENTDVPFGTFDIALYRDDLENSNVQFLGSELEVSLNGKTVIVCDDVMYTGRTVRAAISHIMQMGRPANVRFLALVDRGHRELPFKADYTGKNVPTSEKEGIAVRFTENDGEEGVYIYDK